MHRLWHRQARRLQDGRSQVDKADKIVALPALFETFRPDDRHRHVGGALVAVGLAARERHAVVADDDDDGVLGAAGLFQFVEQFADLIVEALHPGVVVEDVAAHFWGVGPIQRHLDVARLHARLDADTRFVGPMGILAAVPEIEGLIPGQLAQERRKTLGLRAGRVARATAFGDDPRPPALADQADPIARPFQHIGKDLIFLRQVAVQVAALLQAMDHLTSQNRGPRWRATRRDTIGAVKEHAAFGGPVEVRSLHDLIAVDACVWVRPIVGDDDEDVGAFFDGLLGGGLRLSAAAAVRPTVSRASRARERMGHLE